MKHLLFSLFLVISTISAKAQLNLDTCHARAQANYPLIKQYDLIAKATEYNVSNANKAYLPQLSLTGIGAFIIKGFPTASVPGRPVEEPDKFQMIGVAQLNQTIWDGGATKNQKEIIKANAEIDKANVDISLYSIRERVNQVFFGILVIDEQLKLLDILKSNLDRNRKSAELSKENGLAYQTDIEEVQAELLNIDQKIIEFNFSRKSYVDMLSFLTGTKLDYNIQLDKPVSAESTTTYKLNRPELTLYANQKRLVEAQSSLNRVNNNPKIGLIGAGILIEPGMSFGTGKINNLAIAGLSISWNTGGLYRNSNNKNLDKIHFDRINNQQETFTFMNNLQLTQTNGEIEKQKAILQQDHEIIKLKSNIRKSYQLRYENGMSTMNDLINATNKENEALGNQSLHNVQLLMSMYNYKTISGN